MAIISKEMYERNYSLSKDIDTNSESAIRLQNKVNDLIDEIVSYQPLYSTRKKIEQDPNFGIEKMKQVAIWAITKHLGDNNGQEEREHS